jgi:hypothetical protein
VKFKFWYLVLLATAAPGVVVADASPSYDDLVKQAFLAFNDDYRNDWAFTETSTKKERTWVGRFDPRRPAGERWALVSVDGRAPTEDEREAWLSRHADDAGAYNGRNRKTPDIATPGSLVLLEEDEATWLFGFTPQAGRGDEARKFLAKVTGTLRIQKDGPWLEEIKLSNDAPIRVAVVFKISQFLTHFRFGRPAVDGPVVPLSVDVLVKGRAALAISLDEREQIRFSDYERVRPGPPL